MKQGAVHTAAGHRGAAVGTVSTIRAAVGGTAAGRRLVAVAIEGTHRSGVTTAVGTPPRLMTSYALMAHRGTGVTWKGPLRSTTRWAAGSRRAHPYWRTDGEGPHQCLSSGAAATGPPSRCIIYPRPLHITRTNPSDATPCPPTCPRPSCPYASR